MIPVINLLAREFSVPVVNIDGVFINGSVGIVDR